MKHLKLSLCAAMLCLVGAGNSYAATGVQFCTLDAPFGTGPSGKNCTVPGFKLPAYAQGYIAALVRSYYPNDTPASADVTYVGDNGYIYWFKTIATTKSFPIKYDDSLDFSSGFYEARADYVLPAKSFARNTSAKLRLVSRGKSQAYVGIGYN
jgi:hypothetical protein